MRIVSVVVCLAVCLLTDARVAGGAEYYVAPSGGSDSNSGAIGSPFATFGKAIGLATAGDTIFARGGTYNLSSRITIDKAGAASNPIKLFAYPGENPILNFAAQATNGNNRGVQLSNNANWWHVKGLTIQNAGDNGFYTEGDDGVFEQLVTRWNEDSGLQLHGSATRNLVLNCDSYENYDPLTLDDDGTPLPGENSDGFAAKFAGLGTGNVFRGNRAWGNSDDGWDTWNSANGVLMQDCWAFDNGINIWGIADFAGDGTGYKLGKPGGNHVLTNVLAVDNRNGIDINENGSFVQVYNSTSFSNTRNWQFDDDGGALHLLKNNVSLSGTQTDNFVSATTSFNSWNGAAFAADPSDFISTNRFPGGVDLLKLPRLADGGLPDLGNFLKLLAGSNLINAGTPITFTLAGTSYSLPFNGAAPDLGWLETAAPTPILYGDYNGDDVVDATDYTVWRDALNTSTSLPNDETPDSVGPEDYDVWKSHFGESLDGSGSLAAGAVPEPAGLVLLLIAVVPAFLARRK